MSQKSSEVKSKLSLLRAVMQKEKLTAVHLRGVDWFAWATAGGSSVVILTSEVGIAEVLVTANEAWILTNCIEARRLKEEELTEDYRVTEFPWQDSVASDAFIKEKVGSGRIAADRPLVFEESLPASVQQLKWILKGDEVERYRHLGAQAAQAMTEALAKVEPSWTENQVAGAGAQALWSRGIEPTLILVASHERGLKYRHPTARDKKVGDSVMMVFCARAFGLYANLTRFVYFRDLSQAESQAFSDLHQIEERALSATRPGSTLGAVYASLEQAYSSLGHKNEINLHHQGGSTGYLSREVVATPLVASAAQPNKESAAQPNKVSAAQPNKVSAAQLQIETGMAFAWNPSLPGAKVEDTVYLGEQGLEVLTYDSRWPSCEIKGLKRPDVWVRK
jgi:Xaa-Pro aminopeptidase